MNVKSKEQTKCPRCGADGTPSKKTSLVFEHHYDKNKKKIEIHRWSFNSGRMFSDKVDDADEVW